ncbi:MAG: hypothetical protein ACLVBT_11995 [Roseburia hominis]
MGIIQNVGQEEIIVFKSCVILSGKCQKGIDLLRFGNAVSFFHLLHLLGGRKGTGIITDSSDFIGGDGVDFAVQETAAASAAENGSPAGLKYKTKPRSGTEILHW